MSYEFIPHTADIRLKVQGKKQHELFFSAMQGLAEIIKHEGCNQICSEHVELNITSVDTTSLLIDFLSDVLTASHKNKCVYQDVDFLELSQTKLHALIKGYKVDKFDEDIKAVTYHEACVHKNADGNLETIVVFDI